MTTTETPIFTLDNVGVAFSKRVGMFRTEKFWPLREISFKVYHGETLGIIGRNGVGKSTLLRLMAGIFLPDAGRIQAASMRISLLNYQPGFVPHLSGRDNIILGGLLYGLHVAEIKAIMPAIIEFSELADFIDQPLKSYSSGMRARLGFSIAYHADPDVMLIDEALGVGDEVFRRKSLLAMKEKIQSNKTVVLVSHNVGFMRSVCDRIVWLENGRVEAQGPAADILDRYVAAMGK